MTSSSLPIVFEPCAHPYLTSCDVLFGGEMWRRDGLHVAVEDPASARPRLMLRLWLNGSD